MDLDLRKLRYFIAVAEELHFARAAERLHIAQPALSRQIRSLEDDLGVEVFDRDRRGTRLTPAGHQLLEDGRLLLASSQALQRRARNAAHDVAVLTVGFMPGITLTAATTAFAARHPDVQVRLLRTDWTNQVEVIQDGRADVSIVRLPVETEGLSLRPLFNEPRVALLPVRHPLAQRASLRIQDLADDQLLQDPQAVPEWRQAPHPPTTAAAPFEPVHQVEEKLELVASGAGFCVLPLSTATFYTRADVAVRPVEGLAANEVALAWTAARRSPLIAGFAEAAAATLGQGPSQTPTVSV
ncbi:LysR family transcriptional regulator [Streptomyces parvulus]|uniref:LysR family transcriptional regulator n=1 Tax=Streptomyces parvulus TaxID=146923 RepID=UPI0033FA4D5D